MGVDGGNSSQSSNEPIMDKYKVASIEISQQEVDDMQHCTHDQSCDLSDLKGISHNHYLKPLQVPHTHAESLQCIVSEKPHQPLLSFPQRSSGNQKRFFCSSYIVQKITLWLHYHEQGDTVLWFYCHIAERRHLPRTLNKDAAFTTTGVSNWKRAIEKFDKHQNSASHHQAVQMVETIPSTPLNVGEMLSSTHAKQKNWAMLLSSIRFLARQGLALCGSKSI